MHNKGGRQALKAVIAVAVGWLLCCPKLHVLACSLRRLAVQQCSSHTRLYTLRAIGTANSLCCCDDFCGVWVDSHGLRHAGEEHSSSSPGRAMHISTFRSMVSKFDRQLIDCLVHENHLKVTTALGHFELKLRRERCPLGSF